MYAAAVVAAAVADPAALLSSFMRLVASVCHRRDAPSPRHFRVAPIQQPLCGGTVVQRASLSCLDAKKSPAAHIAVLSSLLFVHTHSLSTRSTIEVAHFRYFFFLNGGVP